MKSAVIQILRRFGFRNVLITNGLLTTTSFALCAALNPTTPPALIAIILFFHGATRSMQFTALTTLAYTEIPSERMSRANGFLSAVMQLSLGLGVAVGALTLRASAHLHGHDPSTPLLQDFHLAFLTVAVLSLGPVIDALGLAPEAGAATSGHVQARPNPA
jgi:MFS family permease